ncbi:MAG: alpha-L-arabinofuranosidase, partial [Clostridia bacterium]|nr:alpha-L-arabinofuranosidase [Clostridia bacterium]
YEYFQFCEDIGAKPIPVINCGMTCQWHEALLVDLDKLDPFIQDALDLIEFANGSIDTRWGHKRDEMGHPEPFGLEYIGVGNEQWGHEYFERYELFEKTLREKHPEIKLITSAGWKNRGWEFDLAYDWMENNKDKAYAVDEHFYKEPEWFLNNTDRYNGYDRSLPKVFIGEWAAHTGADGGGIRANRNNLYAALCEAAFLTGVEKNADHVIMSCYAPLLARTDHQEWQPDLIWFDNASAYATPSYYVQKMFSEYTGKYCVETEGSAEGIYISASVLKDKVFLKLINLSGKDTEISISADDLLSEQMKVVAIAGERTDENSVSEPQKVHPFKERIYGREYVLKNNSFTVLELEVTK